MKKLIAIIFSVCTLLGCAAFAYAEGNTSQAATEEEEIIHPELKLVIPNKFETHVDNTPQFDDEMVAEVKCKKGDVPDISWYRFYKEQKNEKGEVISEAHFDLVGKGVVYKVTADDIHHQMKVSVAVSGEVLEKVTEPVEKINYGKVKLKVDNNTKYGDTDGKIYFLDTRMQYTCDEVNIFDVLSDGCVLNSGATLETLDPNGFCWKVRYKDTTLQQGSAWEPFTIAPGVKTPLASITLNCTKRTLTPDEPNYQLKMTPYPDDAYISAVKYISSDEEVATVSDDGLICAVNNGEATITCVVNKGTTSECKEVCEITVKKYDELNAAIIVEDNIEIKLRNNEPVKLTYGVYPSTVVDYTESWRSSDENICIVSDDGIVSGVNAGNAIVTYTITKDDISVIDTVEVEVKPRPSVSNPENWSKIGGQNLSFDFVGCTPNENTIVSILCENGTNEVVARENYSIEPTRITIYNNYLMTVPSGKTTFGFVLNEITEQQNITKEEITENNSSETDPITDNEEDQQPEVPVPNMTTANGTEVSNVALKNADGPINKSVVQSNETFGKKLFKFVSNFLSDETQENETQNTDETVNSTTQEIVTLTSYSVISDDPPIVEYYFKYDYTYHKITSKEYTLESGESFSLVYDSGFDTYYSAPYDPIITTSSYSIIVESIGKNTPTGTTLDLELYKVKGETSTLLETWKLSSTDFVDYSFTLASKYDINIKEDILTGEVEPTIKDPEGNVQKLDDILKNYDIQYFEAEPSNPKVEYTSGVHFFRDANAEKQQSTYLNKCILVPNREGTGYINAYLKLKMINLDKPVTPALDSVYLKPADNYVTVKNTMFVDITKKNIQHMWSQNSTVNLVYTLKGDFDKFLDIYGGDSKTFSDDNVYLVYKSGTSYKTLLMSSYHFKIEQTSATTADLSINYAFLRRLHLGSYPLYIIFKYDGCKWRQDARWVDKGNYILTTFTIVKPGTPITGDKFNPEIWGALLLVTVPTIAIAYYALNSKSRKYANVQGGSHSSAGYTKHRTRKKVTMDSELRKSRGAHEK